MPRKSGLHSQLRWFISLRWIAGVAVVAGGAVDLAFGWHIHANGMLGVGVALLAYNGALSIILDRLARAKYTPRQRTQSLYLLAWPQILLDLACLTLLVLWTGGLHSPMAGFFVFHMVFASLLLPSELAYGTAIAALVILSTGLWLDNQWPGNRADRLILLGQCVALALTVYLANHITLGLRRQRRRLIHQNKSIRAMSRQLKRQQQVLIQHEKMVALGQMAAGVTHEIANPLASMDSVLQLMQRRPEKLKPESVVTLREQVARITQIIHQMKTFAHPADAQRQSMPFNEVVDAAIDMVHFDPRFNKIAIDRDYDANAGSIALLPQATQQVLVNLIINAFDAMAEVEHPRLSIRTRRRAGICTISVADNGTGILPEHVPHVFEPFFTTKPLGKGTGLGLSISYSLIQKQGGSITVKSRPGEGTTFEIMLSTDSASQSRDVAPASVVLSENTGQRTPPDTSGLPFPHGIPLAN